ncbi:Protein of unknown function [Bacillus wiedmannii]|nr:Protein of unknown function [Bacillus wiedmannii]
MLQNIYGENVR